MFGHLLIASVLVFALNVVGSVSSYIESAGRPEALPAIAAVGAQSTATSKNVDVKTEPCRAGHTYEVVIDEKNSSVRVQDQGIDPIYRLGCERSPNDRVLCPNALVKYQMMINNRIVPVSLRCQSGSSIEVTGRAVLTKAAEIKGEEGAALNEIARSMEPERPLTNAEILAAQSPTGISTDSFSQPPTDPDPALLAGKPPAEPYEELNRISGDGVPQTESEKWQWLFSGTPSVLRPERPLPSAPEEIAHTEEEIAARSPFSGAPEPRLASEEPKTLTQRLGESAMKMLDNVDRWWEEFGADTRDAARQQEEREFLDKLYDDEERTKVAEEKNKTAEPDWEALRIEQGGDWAEARNKLEDERDSETDPRTPITQAELDAKRADVVNRGIELLEKGNEEEIRKFNATEELKRLDERYYVASAPARTSAQEEIARIQEEADRKMAALEAQAKQEQFEAEVSRNIDREDADTGVTMREALAAAEAKEAREAAREKEITESIDRYEAEPDRVKVADERNRYPIDPTVGAEQCASATDIRACSKAYVEFEKARSRAQVFGGPITLADLEERPAPRATTRAPEESDFEKLKKDRVFGPAIWFVSEAVPNAYSATKDLAVGWYESARVAVLPTPEPSLVEYGPPSLASSEPPSPQTQYPITPAEQVEFDRGPKQSSYKPQANQYMFDYYIYTWTPYRFKQTMQWLGF